LERSNVSGTILKRFRPGNLDENWL